jgi:FkbM family methyltransferase
LTTNAFDPLALIRNMLGPRAFALADAPPDPELCALLRLGETAAAEGPAVAVALSGITTPRVRALFRSKETSFRTTSGLRFTVDGGDVFAATLAAGYLPESRDFEAFMHLVSPGSVVVDVGANFGLYALSAAAYAQPHGWVFAFEPAPNAFALLQRNIADNGLGASVTAKAAAVAGAAGKARFYVGRDVSFSSLHRTTRLDDGATTVDVEVVTLDEALPNVQSIDLLKIDVEGGEADVLRGARQLLRRSRAPIVQFEFSHKNMDEKRRRAFDETVAMLASDGFRIYRRDVAGPVSLPDPAEPFSGNLFLTRDGEGQAKLQRVLERTHKRKDPRDAGAMALLRSIAQQNEALQHAELLQREAIQVADSIVGDHVSGGSEAVRAMQRAWLETRKRALDAENQVNSLAASVEGRDRLVEQTNEKLANLRAVIMGLEARAGRHEEEREQLLEKMASLRGSIDQLHQALEQARSNLVAAERRNAEKIANWREIEGKLRARVEALEGAHKAAHEKIVAGRAEYDQLMARLKVSESKREHVINVSKRLQERCDELSARLGEEAGASPPVEDQTT